MMAWIIFLFFSNANAGTEFFAKVQELSQAGKYDAALTILQDPKNTDLKAEEEQLVEFNVALLNFKKQNFAVAATQFEDFLKNKSDLQEYAYFYLGSALLKNQKPVEAEKALQKALSMSPNLKLNIEASNLLGQIAIDSKNYKHAKDYIYKLEKRTRNGEQYPEVIYNMARIEKGLHSHAGACKWLKKIYSKYPAYEKVKDWGADLAANEVDGVPSDCRATPEEFRTRIRNLMWSGLDKKAQAEINGVKERLAKADKYLADQLQAQFYLQEGEVQKALDLLKPYYESMKDQFDYLMLLGSASARAGDVQLAVGSYYSAYKLSPKSKLGRQALYQSAFLSYQFQDYDGATRRFQEFMKVYPTSGLIKDAKWHMAWLKYLKGDYSNAYREFSALQGHRSGKKSKSAMPADRNSYWMAMSKYRMGQYDQAKTIFEGLSKDSLIGYYSLAAQARLKKMSTLKMEKAALKNNYVAPRTFSRFASADVLMPSTEEETGFDGEEYESEETLVANQYEDSSDESESADSTENADVKTVDVADSQKDKPSPFASAQLTKKFEQARDLMIVGLTEWARWDLFEIESKTSNRGYLKTLMEEYSSIGHFHRASYIAQTTFGGQRAKYGVDGVRYLWEHAYPKAYSEHVDLFTKKFDVPSELVWGIMRAESQYRRDAISPVGALGLMQVMPFTGHKVAVLLGEKEFVAEKLLEPESAIKFGSRYLKRLMDTFQNTIPLVAAGYNAGPHRVKSWLTNFGTLETDEFIEHIPFLETRNYVKRVMSNCQVYSNMYGNKKEMFPYLADTVPAKLSQENVSKENWDDI